MRDETTRGEQVMAGETTRGERFRKKPVEIAAIQNGGEWKPIMDWLDALAGGYFSVPFGSKPAITRDPATGIVSIETLEGTMRAEVGDWIICGAKGELYPCNPDIFAATYEPVAEEASHGE